MKFIYIRISSLALLFVIFLFTLFGCGEKSYPDLKIILTTSDNDLIGEVSVVAASNNGDVREFLYAGTKEIFIDNPYSDMDITLRARGYKFFTVNVNLDELKQEESCYKKELTLEKLQPFIKSDDFVTGFKSDTGPDAFKSLAFKTDTSIGKAYAVKFYIKDVDDNPTVYFINSKKHPIHFDFVKTF
ncbi:MAG: hypothetical protein JXR91_02975, partial [Deltaproteobacteria bacterium]|nr:hypothetical protein [Deltaproteobacteria bacterium]